MARTRQRLMLEVPLGASKALLTFGSGAVRLLHGSGVAFLFLLPLPLHSL